MTPKILPTLDRETFDQEVNAKLRKGYGTGLMNFPCDLMDSIYILPNVTTDFAVFRLAQKFDLKRTKETENDPMWQKIKKGKR